MIRSFLSTLNDIVLIRIILISIIGIIICFLTIQHVGGYSPCNLCIQEQRIYYFGFLVAIAINISNNSRNYNINFYLIAVLCLLMICNIIISVIHIGIEWKIWEDTLICTDSSKIESITNTTDLLTQIGEESIPSCSKVNIRILELSLVWWNIISSFFILSITSIAMLKSFQKK
ncbi:disulfide bond formation protein B [Candidatus Liberibacter brunswickensis]|uniref:disulfide bond formation protein B n=1 Tax=Candidatus Liberibacter brunswickensis TaxID=1968796 RepID=UPI002FE00111